MREVEIRGGNPVGRADVSIRRPSAKDWNGIIDVLRTANFAPIGCSEMPTFPLKDSFIAVAGKTVVGVCGYRILDATTAKTTLLAVDAGWRGMGIGELLQNQRLAFIKAAGAKRIFTNTDDARVIDWLVRRYGFRRTGKTIPKTCGFGKPGETCWVNLVLEV